MRICPDNASAANAAEVVAQTSSCASSSRFRLSASPITPAIGPRNSIGRLRAAVMTATSRVECVASYVKIPATSSSSQRIALPTPPANHSRA